MLLFLFFFFSFSLFLFSFWKCFPPLLKHCTNTQIPFLFPIEDSCWNENATYIIRRGPSHLFFSRPYHYSLCFDIIEEEKKIPISNWRGFLCPQKQKQNKSGAQGRRMYVLYISKRDRGDDTLYVCTVYIRSHYERIRFGDLLCLLRRLEDVEITSYGNRYQTVR